MERMSLTPFADQEIQGILRKGRGAGSGRAADGPAGDRTRMMFTMDFCGTDIVAINIYARGRRALFPRLPGGVQGPGGHPLAEMVRENPAGERLESDQHGESIDRVEAPLGPRAVADSGHQGQARFPGSLGVILIDVDMSLISRICHDSRIGERGSIALLDEDGGLLYRSSEEDSAPR